jgi:hypothetical protein
LRCQRRGLSLPIRLPDILTCPACGFGELARQGARVVHSFDANRFNGADNRRKPPTQWRNRVLAPRVPMVPYLSTLQHREG